MATRNQFLSAYKQELERTYDWAKDPAKLAKYLAFVEATLEGARTWNHDGNAAERAFKTIGAEGRYSLKALRGLGRS